MLYKEVKILVEFMLAERVLPELATQEEIRAYNAQYVREPICTIYAQKNFVCTCKVRKVSKESEELRSDSLETAIRAAQAEFRKHFQAKDIMDAKFFIQVGDLQKRIV